jgi:hypothetical protein
VTPDPVRAIADAVLYEGYILWPYRRSALKNQRRFTFGGVYPPAHSRGHPDDPAMMRTEVLIMASEEAHVEMTVRFLQVVRRAVARQGPDGLQEVDELDLDGQRYTTWEEATEREVKPPPTALSDLASAPSRTSIAIGAGRKTEELPGGAGALVRTWHGLEGGLEVAAERLDVEDVWRLSVHIENTTPFADDSREEALAHTFCSMPPKPSSCPWRIPRKASNRQPRLATTLAAGRSSWGTPAGPPPYCPRRSSSRITRGWRQRVPEISSMEARSISCWSSISSR